MGGMIAGIKKLQTRSGSFMAFVTVEDMYGTVECVCFPNVYDRVRSFLAIDAVVSLSGKIDINEEKAPTIIVDRMTEFKLEEGSAPVSASKEKKEAEAPPKKEQPAAPKKLWLNISQLEQEDVDELMETLCFYEGETSVCFVKEGKKFLCSQKVNPNRALMAELSSFLREDCIKLV